VGTADFRRLKSVRFVGNGGLNTLRPVRGAGSTGGAGIKRAGSGFRSEASGDRSGLSGVAGAAVIGGFWHVAHRVKMADDELQQEKKNETNGQAKPPM